MRCVNCDEEMKTNGILNSGNARYQIFVCQKCGFEKERCIGVLNDA